MKNKKSGFTLLEILLVVGIISILAGIVIVAINPSKQLATVRNTERKSDIKQIDSALTQYYIDNNHYPSSVLGSLIEVCDTGSTASSSVVSELGANYCTGLINLSELVPTYLTAIPKDPQATTTGGAGYKVIKSSTTGKTGLSALGELDQAIAIGEAVVDSGEEVVPPVDEEAAIVAGLREGLIGHWPLSSNLVSTVGNNTGVLTGDSTYVAGLFGNALRLDGVGNYVSFSDSIMPTGDSDWSLSMYMNFIKIPQDVNYPTVVSWGTASDGYKNLELLALFNGGDKWYVTSYGSDSYSTQSVTTGWVNLVMVHSNSETHLYIDNVEVVNFAQAINITRGGTLTLNESPFWQVYGSRAPNAEYQELAIWNRALDSGERADLCNDTGSGCTGRSLVQ